MEEKQESFIKEYVLGFAFSGDLSNVLLIEKQTPEWQKGKLNGIGGKIEPGETGQEAMVREFREETGLVTDYSNWSHFCTMSGFLEGWSVTCYVGTGVGVYDARKTETEKPVLKHVADLTSVNCKPPIISNLRWLVPMALEHLTDTKTTADVRCKQ